MVDASKLTLEQIIILGIDALAESLGPAGMERFMDQFEKGSGDYTRDRDKILGNSTDRIAALTAANSEKYCNYTANQQANL